MHRWKHKFKVPGKKEEVISPMGLGPRDSKCEKMTEKHGQKCTSTYSHASLAHNLLSPADDILLSWVWKPLHKRTSQLTAITLHWATAYRRRNCSLPCTHLQRNTALCSVSYPKAYYRGMLKASGYRSTKSLKTNVSSYQRTRWIPHPWPFLADWSK